MFYSIYYDALHYLQSFHAKHMKYLFDLDTYYLRRSTSQQITRIHFILSFYNDRSQPILDNAKSSTFEKMNVFYNENLSIVFFSFSACPPRSSADEAISSMIAVCSCVAADTCSAPADVSSAMAATSCDCLDVF